MAKRGIIRGIDSLMKKKLTLALKILISLLLMVFLFTKINFFDFIKTVHDIKPLYLIIGTAIFILSFYINALKWKALLPEKKILYLFNMNMIAGFYSTILPGQVAGEAAKIVFMRRDDKNLERITASVLVDKISGFIGIIIVGIIGCIFSTRSVGFLTWMLVVLMIILTLCLLLFKSDRVYFIVKKWLDLAARKIRFINKIEGFITSWREYSKDNRALTLNILLGVLYQIVGVLLYFVFSKTININVSLMDFSWIFSVLSLALFLPVSISGIGVRDGTLIGLLGLFGVSNEKAMALSMIMLLTNVIRGLIGGLVNLYYMTRQKRNLDSAEPQDKP